jgi:hypothetical protein
VLVFTLTISCPPSAGAVNAGAGAAVHARRRHPGNISTKARAAGE